MRERINEFKIVQKRQTGASKYKDKSFSETTGFVDERAMNFDSNKKMKGAVISEIFLSKTDNLIHGKHVTHHLHIIGEILGYTFSI